MYRKTFLQRMSMLSLNKSNNKPESASASNMSQDLLNDSDKIDLSLPVTNINKDQSEKNEEDKTVNDFTKEVSSTIKLLRVKFDSRLAVAKAREGLAYALDEEGNLPPFCKINLYCRPDLQDRSMANQLAEIWSTKERSVKETLIRESVEFLDRKLSDMNSKISETYENANSVIGVASPSAGEARSQLKRRYIDIKERNEKELAEFKTDIRSKRDKPSWRKHKVGSKHRGRPY